MGKEHSHKDQHSEIWKLFEENGITHSAAHHLTAVLELRQSHGYARVTDVAKHLSITTGSASTNLKNLKSKGFIIEDENRFLILTEAGEKLARDVQHRKGVLLTFLTDILKVDPEIAEIDACKTEHLISVETTKKLEKFIQSYEKLAGK